VLNDQSGVYADVAGPGSVVAARLAVEDFGGRVGTVPVEVLFADHQNRPDVGLSITRQWFDRDGVSMVIDIPTSSVALAVAEVAREKNRVFIASGAASADLTGRACSPNTVHWTMDNVAIANSVGKAIVAAGGRSWFFITADYAFGQDLETQVSTVVRGAGGELLGAVRHPLGASDFSSFLLQAQRSRAQIVGLANGGGDTINCIRQAAEFGIVQRGQKLASLLIAITDIHALVAAHQPSLSRRPQQANPGPFVRGARWGRRHEGQHDKGDYSDELPHFVLPTRSSDAGSKPTLEGV
jgi:branched-chain amino acid transport system substrate-binding protein